jgi:hypothetical protein
MLKFLCRIDAETPQHLDVHLVADNYASWINQVERFFGLITGDRIRRGFQSVP